MKRKRNFFLTINYIQVSLSVFFIGWIFGYKRMDLLDEDYIGLVVFSILIIFISNSLTNIFSANVFVNQLSTNKIIATAEFILTILFILSVVVMFIFSVIGFYTFFFERTDGPRFNLGIVVAMLLAVISLIVLVNQYYFRKHQRIECSEKLEAEINIIGVDTTEHE